MHPPLTSPTIWWNMYLFNCRNMDATVERVWARSSRLVHDICIFDLYWFSIWLNFHDMISLFLDKEIITIATKCNNSSKSIKMKTILLIRLHVHHFNIKLCSWANIDTCVHVPHSPHTSFACLVTSGEALNTAKMTNGTIVMGFKPFRFVVLDKKACAFKSSKENNESYDEMKSYTSYT